MSARNGDEDDEPLLELPELTEQLGQSLAKTDRLLGPDGKMRPELEKALESRLFPKWVRTIKLLFVWAYFEMYGRSSESMHLAFEMYKKFKKKTPQPLPNTIIIALEQLADEDAAMRGLNGVIEEGILAFPLDKRTKEGGIVIDLRRHFRRKQKQAKGQQKKKKPPTEN